jgi:hypothetical protein
MLSKWKYSHESFSTIHLLLDNITWKERKKTTNTNLSKWCRKRDNKTKIHKNWLEIACLSSLATRKQQKRHKTAVVNRKKCRNSYSTITYECQKKSGFIASDSSLFTHSKYIHTLNSLRKKKKETKNFNKRNEQ